MDSQSLSQSPGEGSIRNPRQRHRDKEERGSPDKARVLEDSETAAGCPQGSRRLEPSELGLKEP